MSDVLSVLAGQQYEWDKHDSLRLDERYRTRHRPLLVDRPRGALGPDPEPGEFWPPARSLVVPLPDPHPEPFLSALADSSLTESIWWRGLELRADRVHATLVHGSDEHDTSTHRSISSSGALDRQFNTGRIYLPVEPADGRAAVKSGGVVYVGLILRGCWSGGQGW